MSIENYVLILHGDGENNSTDIIDEFGKTVTVSGNAKLTTSNYKFGSASISFDGSNSAIYLPDSDDWDLGLGDFTIDFWIYPTSFSSYRGIIGTSPLWGHTWTVYTYTNGIVRVTCDGANSDIVTSGDKTLTLNQWNHVAVVRKGTGASDLNIAINGVFGNAPQSGNVTMNSSNSGLVIGDFYLNTGGHVVSGLIDELHLVKGEAIWTENFTAPTSPINIFPTQTITSDATFFGNNSNTISSDSLFRLPHYSDTILSDSLFVTPIIYNVSNRINVIKAIYNYFDNKINVCKQGLDYFRNVIFTVRGKYYDFANKVSTQARKTYSFSNIINVLIPEYAPETLEVEDSEEPTFIKIRTQSLGKSYVRVYLDDVLQDDVIVDSIIIKRNLNAAATATFTLAKAYDSTKPSSEISVKIYYDSSLRFSGKVRNISQSDSTEEITISASDKYADDEKIELDFMVGHEPPSNNDTDYPATYYSKISEALSYLKMPAVGYFVPQTMSCAGEKSGIITSLITQAGNYGWFYERDGKTPRLWTGGRGSIKTFQRQSIGVNLNIFQVLSHNLEVDFSNIITGFKVKMGKKTLSNNGQYKYIRYYRHKVRAIPAWDKSLEVLASDSVDGYGWDFPNPDEPDKYKDVYTKYYLENFGVDDSYSENSVPEVTIWGAGVRDTFDSYFSTPSEIISDGFTIDYNEKTITFSEKKYWYTKPAKDFDVILNSFSCLIDVELDMYKVISGQIDLSDKPIIFDVGGSTNQKILELSDLNIQEGQVKYIYIKGIKYKIPLWNDTKFATDIAKWKLNDVNHKKISGNIKLTIDAVSVYDLNLNDRIFVAGITEYPLNIISISENYSSFTVDVELSYQTSYSRTVSMQSRGIKSGRVIYTNLMPALYPAGFGRG